ncbi:MAG TPA: ABC transporter ATP-binding protein, partial [Candidatus Limnocylindrales bacterium]
MLEVSGLSVSYGKHRALSDVAASCAKGEIVVVLGTNGAGKSTLLKAIAGLVQPQPGTTVTLSGIDLLALGPHEIVEAGVALVPEGRGIFPDLTVRENLELGAYAARARRGETAQRASVLRLFPRLAERFGQRAGTMSGGEQQMVAIGRALMSAPDILLLDEPSLGLSPALSKELFQALARVRGAGLGILLVEQNARASLAIADRGLIIENGRNAGEGTGAALLEDASVQRAYLGGALSANGPAGRRPPPRHDGALAGEPPRRLLAEPTQHEPSPPTPLALVREQRRTRQPTAREEPPMNAINLLIAGKDRPATGHSVFERRNPISGEVATTVAAATVEDAIRAADAAAAAFPAWSQLGPN